MSNRLTLQNILEELLPSKEVYFQPPESVKMKYPAFVYTLDDIPSDYADDYQYKTYERYLVTYITKNPDDPLVSFLWDAKGFRFDRRFCSDNLHHFVYMYTFY